MSRIIREARTSDVTDILRDMDVVKKTMVRLAYQIILKV